MFAAGGRRGSTVTISQSALPECTCCVRKPSLTRHGERTTACDVERDELRRRAGTAIAAQRVDLFGCQCQDPPDTCPRAVNPASRQTFFALAIVRW